MRDKPYRDILGGICWTPRAFLSIEKTIETFTNDVPITTKSGMRDRKNSKTIT